MSHYEFRPSCSFSRILVGGVEIVAREEADIFELVPSSGVILTPDTMNRKITVSLDVSYSRELAEELSPSVKTGTTWDSKVSMNLESLTLGNYVLWWGFAWNTEVVRHPLEARVIVGGVQKARFRGSPSTARTRHGEYPVGSGSDARDYVSGKVFLFNTSGNVSISLDWRASKAGKAVSMWDARLEFWRAS